MTSKIFASFLLLVSLSSCSIGMDPYLENVVFGTNNINLRPVEVFAFMDYGMTNIILSFSVPVTPTGIIALRTLSGIKILYDGVAYDSKATWYDNNTVLLFENIDNVRFSEIEKIELRGFYNMGWEPLKPFTVYVNGNKRPDPKFAAFSYSNYCYVVFNQPVDIDQDYYVIVKRTVGDYANIYSGFTKISNTVVKFDKSLAVYPFTHIQPMKVYDDYGYKYFYLEKPISNSLPVGLYAALYGKDTGFEIEDLSNQSITATNTISKFRTYVLDIYVTNAYGISVKKDGAVIYQDYTFMCEPNNIKIKIPAAEVNSIIPYALDIYASGIGFNSVWHKSFYVDTISNSVYYCGIAGTNYVYKTFGKNVTFVNTVNMKIIQDFSKTIDTNGTMIYNILTNYQLEHIKAYYLGDEIVIK